MFRIRGHTLLCLQGFRGKGYSESFVDNMKEIHDTLFREPGLRGPGSEVEVVVGPDDICAACPYLKESGCRLNGIDKEGEMERRDNFVIKLLGINPLTAYRWEDILVRISERLTTDILKVICRRCEWYPLGYCEEGIAALQKSLQHK